MPKKVKYARMRQFDRYAAMLEHIHAELVRVRDTVGRDLRGITSYDRDYDVSEAIRIVKRAGDAFYDLSGRPDKKVGQRRGLL